jgi:quercetin dioxygenase-like cupin family protein
VADKIVLKDSIEYSAGSIVSKQILNKKSGSITLFAFDVGQSLSDHTSPYDAMLQVLEGTAKVVIGGAASVIDEGGMIIMEAGAVHSVEAVKRLKVMLVMILS